MSVILFPFKTKLGDSFGCCLNVIGRAWWFYFSLTS